MLVETLTELNLNEREVEDYSYYELTLIENFMLAKQVKCSYLTLCKKCHKKQHMIDINSNIYKTMFYNPYGKFFFVDVNLIQNIKNKYLTKLLYLACFSDYSNYIRWGKSKGNYANKKDIHEILKGNNESFYEFYNYCISNGYIYLENEKHVINKKLISRGAGDSIRESARIFTDNFFSFYHSKSPKIRGKVGAILKLINICNYTTNEIYLTHRQIKHTLNISKSLNAYINGNNNANGVMDLLISTGPDKYTLNPSIIYKGDLIVKNKDFLNKYIKKERN